MGFDNNSFDDLRTRPDETVIFDDRGVGLQRLENAADANAAREVDVPADLGTRPDRRQVSTIVPSSM